MTMNQIRLKVIMAQLNNEIDARKKAIATYKADKIAITSHMGELKQYFVPEQKYRTNWWGEKIPIEHDGIFYSDCKLLPRNDVPEHLHKIYDGFSGRDLRDYRYHINDKIGIQPKGIENLEKHKAYWDLVYNTHGGEYLINITAQEYIQTFE